MSLVRALENPGTFLVPSTGLLEAFKHISQQPGLALANSFIFATAQRARVLVWMQDAVLWGLGDGRYWQQSNAPACALYPSAVVG